LTLLECEKLICGYHGKPVLDSVSFSAGAGEAIALLGPNGSGKSTLLKTLCGTLRPLGGRAALQGIELGQLTPREIARRVAYVPQDENVSFPFSVRDMVTMGRLAVSTGLRDTPEDIAMATVAMEKADCLALESRSVMELSGGERQRAWIARALAQDAKLLLLDEPTSHLDVSHQISVCELIKGLTRMGHGALIAVHDLNLATRFATRVIVLSGGVVALDAPLDEAMASPVLDRAYDVRFERIRTSDGRTILVPLPAHDSTWRTTAN
jgi:iron complex transport system ATP-binding protein